MSKSNSDSVVYVHGEYRGSDLCGYCHADLATSFGMTALSLDVNTYDKLINLGWRRSGCFLYKPVMHKTCCPAYTIRLKANDFNISKDQKLVMRRFDRFLATGSIHIPSESNDNHHTSYSSNTKTTESVSLSINDTSNNNTDMPMSISSHKLDIQTVTPEYTLERFELYRKYQISIHNDLAEDLSIDGFTRFLCSTPLQSSHHNSNNYVMNSMTGEKYTYGTYHQLYRLDGILIAISVIDILPTGLSSVYVIYDPDMRHLVLGKVTAVRDISFCREFNLPYYYMGFYIHSCVKMRYKGDYKPSELLCPTSMVFYPIAQVVPLINRHKFTPLAPILAEARHCLVDNIETETRLQEFLPKLGDACSLHDIRLDLSMDDYLRINDLSPHGVQIVTPILQNLIAQTGAVAKELVVKLR